MYRQKTQTYRHTPAVRLTLNAGEYDPGMIVCNDVSVAVLWFVHLQVGVLPCELLTGVDGLEGTRNKVRLKRKTMNKFRHAGFFLC